MEDCLRRFYTLKDISVLAWAAKKATAKPNAQRTELVRNGKVNQESNAGTWMPSMKWGEMNAWLEYISHEIDVSKEFAAEFNFLKIHLMSHCVQQICRYRALQQYSAERQEQAHKTNLKNSWNASNHNLNYMPQVITFERCILCFEMSERNLQGLAQRRGNCTATCKVLPSGADRAAPLSSQSYVKPEFMGSHICHDGKHPDAMIKDVRVSLDNA